MLVYKCLFILQYPVEDPWLDLWRLDGPRILGQKIRGAPSAIDIGKGYFGRPFPISEAEFTPDA